MKITYGKNTLDHNGTIKDFIDSRSLTKKIIGYKKNGEVFDLHVEPNNNESAELIELNSNEGRNIFRHTLAHITAHAIKKVFGKVEFGIGPVTEEGFYYDFSMEKRVSEKDFAIIEETMQKIIESNFEIVREVTTKEKFLSEKYDSLKEEILKNINEEITTYSYDNFTDLCSGPHLRRTGLAPLFFKLTGISEVTWHNRRLQRIVGVAFASEEELEEYKRKKIEEHENDHRVIGKKMDLFSFNELSHGFATWHPKGVLYLSLVKEVISKTFCDQYKEIKTPEIWSTELWKKTGHWEHYKDKMFCCGENQAEGMKPMSCPAHTLFFKNETRSYRDLPFRIFEFGDVFRNEDTGGLMGLKRVRRMTQDDGHIFCSLDQIEEEIKSFIQKTIKILSKFGFSDFLFKVATKPEKAIGDPNSWEIAENSLKNALSSLNIKYEIDEGEGAFYGPKIEIHLKDSGGRMWQCGTIQVDFNLSTRLDARYIEKNGDFSYPVILHRASLGTLERFTAMLLEHHKGLPFFINPVQVGILPINSKHLEYCKEIQTSLVKNGIRTEIFSDESISKRIKRLIIEKVGAIVIIGDKEVEKNIINLRENDNTNKEFVSQEEFIEFCFSKC